MTQSHELKGTCAFCPTSHAFAGAGALDRLHGVDSLPPDAQLARNMIQGFDIISNHITHLYMLWFPDLVNPAYSGVIEKKLWVKAPRYDSKACEVGLLARLLIAEEPLITGLAKEFKKRKLPVASVYMRLIARIQEMLVAGYLLEGWINEFNPKGIFRETACK